MVNESQSNLMAKYFTKYTMMLLITMCVLTTSGCTKDPVKEKWIGHYSFPSHPEKFPLYVDIVINGEAVRGKAIDGNREIATVTGTLKNGYYELLLHPMKHGENKKQDVWYKGNRNGNHIIGEWEHVVGAGGPWNATLTTLGVNEAIKPYIKPCKKVEDKSNNCENA